MLFSRCTMLFCGLAWTMCASLSAQTSAPGSSPAVELGSPLTDLRTGVSVRGPAGADMERITSQTQIVRWVKRDDKTKTILWAMNIQKNEVSKKKLDLQTYAKELLPTLTQVEKFDSPKIEFFQVDGKDAFEIKSAKGDDKARFWQHQVWVQHADGQFIIFVIAGPLDAKDRLDAIMSAVVKTAKFMDPKAIAALRDDNLNRGTAVLTSLDEKKFAPAIGKGLQWFRISSGGKDIGFMAQTAEAAKIGDAPALRVKVWLSIDAQGQKSVLKRDLLASFDRSADQWKDMLTPGGGKPTGEEGSVQAEKLTAKTIDAKPVTRTSKVPVNNYLPRATGVVLPTLIDLTKPASYAFLVYDTFEDRFNTRTVTVIGPETIKIDGNDFKAVRLSDQGSVESTPTTVFVDGKGFMLRMEADGGLTMEAVSLESIVKIFPEAKNIIKD